MKIVSREEAEKLISEVPRSLLGARRRIDTDHVYSVGQIITSTIVFICCWIYAILEYGFLFGVGFGWLPSLIVAIIAGFLWPLLLIALFVLLCYW